MAVYKDDKNNSWYCKFYYTDYTGKKKQKMKRGFKLQREAKDWERQFLEKQAGEPSMKLSALADLYLEDKKEHTKRITYETKKNRIDTWVLPFLGERSVDSITAVDVRKWQADLKTATSAKGTTLSPGYMQNIVTELSSLMNFAVRFYGLTSNPCQVAGNTVGKKTRSMQFWTKEEFDKFIKTFEKDDPYYTAFLILYYCGIRIGELEALTVGDVDMAAGEIVINKTYHMINGEEIITAPKTKKSNRSITVPPFLLQCVKRHTKRIYAPEASDRLFKMVHSSYAKQQDKHTQEANIKRIRLHDIRHSNASLLIELGFSALLVSERLGHENVSTTLNIYSHLFPSKQSEVSDRLQDLCKDSDY